MRFGNLNIEGNLEGSDRNNIYDNITLNAFRIAINGSLSQFNMIDGVVDEYEDETGIDTASSTHEDYDATDDYYSNEKTAEGYTSDLLTGGTPSALHADTPAFACDDNTGTTYSHSSTRPWWWKYDFGAGNGKTITKLLFKSPKTGTAGGNATIKDFTLEGSDNDSDWDVVYTGQITNDTNEQSFTFTNSTSYRYYKINVTTAWCTDNEGYIYEIEMMETVLPTTYNMTLISNNTEAEAEPTEGRLVILEQDVDAITINTDLKAYVSLDNGANWEQVTLTDEGDFDGSKRVLVGSKSLTDRSDKTMVYKLITYNNKELKIHGTGMFWR